MHSIEPYLNWLKYYDPAFDSNTPYYGKIYNFDYYSNTIYGYYIDPGWDEIGSETLYIKILFADYNIGFMIIEFIGEWNDAITNDVMYLKRNIIDKMVRKGITKFVLIGEHVLNFHGSDDCYYEEWFEDIEDGWIAAVNFREFVLDEMKQFNIDTFINSGGSLQIENWRTMKPLQFFKLIDSLITRRLGPGTASSFYIDS